MVRTERRVRFLGGLVVVDFLESTSMSSGSEGEEDGVYLSPTDTASTVSATASSSLLGSKMMFSATAATSSVMGGLENGFDALETEVVRG